MANGLLGNSKASVIVTLSPAGAHFMTSYDSIEFALEVKGIKLDVSANVAVDPKEQVKKLKVEIADLKKQLKAALEGAGPAPALADEPPADPSGPTAAQSTSEEKTSGPAQAQASEAATPEKEKSEEKKPEEKTNEEKAGVKKKKKKKVGSAEGEASSAAKVEDGDASSSPKEDSSPQEPENSAEQKINIIVVPHQEDKGPTARDIKMQKLAEAQNQAYDEQIRKLEKRCKQLVKQNSALTVASMTYKETVYEAPNKGKASKWRKP